MSDHHSTQQFLFPRSKQQLITRDLYRRPYNAGFDDYSSYSGSPPSSSPPKTPYSTRGYQIHSSPGFLPEPFYKPLEERTAYSSGASTYWKSSSFSSPSRPEIDPFKASRYAGYDITSSQVSEETTESDEEMEEIFGLSNRTTVFRTSAERGLWKRGPMPLTKSSPIRLQTRKSAPSLSRVPTPTLLTTRPLSEPAISLLTQSTSFSGGNISPDSGPVGDDITSPLTLPSLTSDRESSEDMDTELEVEDPGILSPLPPSSPPLSPMSRSMSISRPSSPLSGDRPSSPLSELPEDYEDEFKQMQEDFSYSAPIIEPEIILNSSVKPGADVLSNANLSDGPHVPLNSKHPGSPLLSSASSPLGSAGPTLELATCPTSKTSSGPGGRKLLHLNDVDLEVNKNSSPASPLISFNFDPPNRSISPSTSPSGPASFFGSPVTDSFVHVDTRGTNEDKEAGAIHKEGSDDVGNDVTVSEPETSQAIVLLVDGSEREEKIKVDEEIVKDVVKCTSQESPNMLKDKNGVFNRCSTSAEARSASPAESLSKKKRVPTTSNGPAKKKRKVEPDSDEASTSRSIKLGSPATEDDDKEDTENDRYSAEPASNSKKRRRDDMDAKAASIKRKPRKRPRAHTPEEETGEEDQYNEPLDNEAKSVHMTMCGLIIETMATTRASSLPVSTIYKLVMRSQPSFKPQRTEGEWLRIIERVLRDGEARRGCGVFGKVDSSGKDRSDRPLEAQWFYVPERDEDQDRATLIRSMMPRPGKRTETMKYKQYYWQPLGKISKWDGEDDL